MHKHCPSCGRDYAYDLPVCTFCAVDLEEVTPESGRALAVTLVSTPSTGHEEVPYWVALVESSTGVQQLVKSDREIRVGDEVSLATAGEGELETVGILGSGTMGASLVELLLQRRHPVVWVSRSLERLERARGRVFERLARVMDELELADADARLTISDGYDALAPCDVVIEAVAEEIAVKLEVLPQAEAAMRGDAFLTTNTSGIPLDDLAIALARPQRFGGLHFFNPATRMRLVETSVAEATDEETSAFLDDFARTLGKVPVRVASKPAFVVNRVLMPLLNEAVRTLEEGVAPAESIDEAIRLGLNHPMGPLALADMIGLDVVVEIMDNLAQRTGDASYEPRPKIRELVAAGKLGRKTGEGFYSYQR